jgi:hypothetical protein
MMAETLLTYGRCHMLQDEPEHCAVSMLVTVEMLYKARTELDRLRGRQHRPDLPPGVSLYIRAAGPRYAAGHPGYMRVTVDYHCERTGRWLTKHWHIGRADKATPRAIEAAVVAAVSFQKERAAQGDPE